MGFSLITTLTATEQGAILLDMAVISKKSRDSDIWVGDKYSG
jgi:hypothetical protein